MLRDEVNRRAALLQRGEPARAAAERATESGRRGEPTPTPGLGPRSQLRQEKAPEPGTFRAWNLPSLAFRAAAGARPNLCSLTCIS